WETTDADTTSIDPDVGTVTPAGNGTKLFAPQQEKSYTLTAKGPGGEVTSAPVTVKVIKKPVITSFGANPPQIEPGQSSALFWSITGATSASIDQGVGAVDSKAGSIPVSPSAKTTYTLTASGPGGPADPKSVTVRVEPKPQTYTITLESSGGGNLATTDTV